jgi:hypothetical protein
VRRPQAATRSSLRDLQHYHTLDYVLVLLRYHRPGFDELALEERADLIAETCAHINEFVEVLHKLMTFLEHGKLERRGPAAARDIKAAVLKDVDKTLDPRRVADPGSVGRHCSAQGASCLKLWRLTNAG